ncbi:MAG: hypothetical protein OEY23_13665, partial [Acidimicrobiia bacterium]|nr:hypothetical protein [Acidimicrobiia bacterium]
MAITTPGARASLWLGAGPVAGVDVGLGVAGGEGVGVGGGAGAGDGAVADAAAVVIEAPSGSPAGGAG